MEATKRKPVANTVKIDGGYYRPGVGTALEVNGGIPGRLLPGDDFVDSGFPGCDFRWASMAGDIAINVTITGRTLRWRHSAFWIRARVEWVGDCEPSTFDKGWVLAASCEE